ncbi:hypothetical protein DMENIID0001_065160 [Sergentomyia squamirostris]
MDYVDKFPHRVCLIAFVALIIQACSANIDRDILLTPNRTNTLPSYKFQHYDPSESSLQDISGENVVTHAPWEEALKYTAYLALAQNTVNSIQRGNKDKVPPKSDTMRLPSSSSATTESSDDKAMNDALRRAPLIGYDTSSMPKFGDIVLVARGVLEKSPIGQFRFVQTLDGPICLETECLRQIPENVTALWSVHRIRHRDSERKHRFELRFSIVPLAEIPAEPQRDARAVNRESPPARNYILRDDEYPQLFTNNNIYYSTDQPIRRYDRIQPSISRTIFELMPFFRRPVMPHPPSFTTYTYNPFGVKTMRPYDLNAGEYLYTGVDKPMKSVYIKRPSNYIFTSPKNHDFFLKPFVPDFMKLPSKDVPTSEEYKGSSLRPHVIKPQFLPTAPAASQPDANPTTIKPNFVTFPYNYVYTDSHKSKRPIMKNSLIDYMKFQKSPVQTISPDYTDYVKTNLPVTTKYSNDAGKYQNQETTTYPTENLLQNAISIPSFATFPNTHYAIPIQVQLVTPPGFHYLATDYPTTIRYMAPSIHIPHPHLLMNQSLRVNSLPSSSAAPSAPSAPSVPSAPSSPSGPSAPSGPDSFTPYVPKRSSSTPNTITSQDYNKRFRSSSKYERNRYSDPDPLYHHHADQFTTLMPFRRPVEVTTIRQSLPIRHYSTSSTTPFPVTSSSFSSTISPSLSSIYSPITAPSSSGSYSTSSISSRQEIFRGTHRTHFQPIVAEEVNQPAVSESTNIINEVVPERKISEIFSTTRPDLFYPLDDAINVQLPAPDNQKKFIYEETSPEPKKTSTSTTTTTPVVITPTKRQNEERQRSPVTTNRPTQTLPQTTLYSSSSSTTPVMTIKPRIHRTRLYLPRTTEKPVLKWMPKSRRPRPTSTTTHLPSVQITTPKSQQHRRVHPIRTTSTTTTTTTTPSSSIVGPTVLDELSVSSATEKVVTVTPSTVNDNDDIQTRQSFITSISFEVGDHIQHSLPNVAVTDTAEIANEIPHPEPVTMETTTQMIEMVRADLQEIPTNVTNVAVFTAEEEVTSVPSSPQPTPADDQLEDNTLAQLARSIVNHAKRITAENDLQTTTTDDYKK